MEGEGAGGRMRFGGVLETSAAGLRRHPGRTMLTALGIAFGIAAIVAVLGITASGRAALIARLDQLGTNLIRVTPGSSVFGNADGLPAEAAAMLGRVGPVERVASTALLDVTVLRNDLLSPLETGGLSVLAAPAGLPEVLNVRMAAGRFLDEAAEAFPTAVLGRVAAERLGIADVDRTRRVYIGGEWFEVIGVLGEMTLHPDIERSVVIGEPAARDLFIEDLKPTALYARVHPDRVGEVLAVIPATVDPANPGRVAVTRPVEALVARRQTEAALTGLLVSLGAVALLVGGVAIANVMVMSVMERRAEIGLRRALGATRRHIRRQFLGEAVLLAGMGGVLGAAVGASVTAAFAVARGLAITVPLSGLGASVLSALAVGALAGVYPAVRAARIPPAEAVRSP